MSTEVATELLFKTYILIFTVDHTGSFLSPHKVNNNLFAFEIHDENKAHKIMQPAPLLKSKT